MARYKRLKLLSPDICASTNEAQDYASALLHTSDVVSILRGRIILISTLLRAGGCATWESTFVPIRFEAFVAGLTSWQNYEQVRGGRWERLRRMVAVGEGGIRSSPKSHFAG